MKTDRQPHVLLQVIPALTTGGAERTAIDIGAAVRQLGWTSLLASAGGRMEAELPEHGIESVRLPAASKNPVTLIANAFRLARIIRDRKVDIIHARSRAPAWSAFWAAKMTDTPFVTTYHGAYNQTNAAKAMYNSVMARADVVIANSNWTGALIAERHPWARDAIVPIARGTDFEAFSQSTIGEDRRQRVLASWGVDPDRPILLHLARLTAWKGQMVVIEAAAKIIDQHPNVQIVLAGDAQGRDTYLASLRARIAELKLENHVFLPGHCDDPACAMAVADGVVVASIEAEAFGRAAVEAAALERPAIVTRIGAVGETVLAQGDVDDSTFTGWKVPPNDPQTLADAMAALLNLSPKERAIIGQRARAFAKSQFSLQQMCEKTIAVYESLLAN